MTTFLNPEESLSASSSDDDNCCLYCYKIFKSGENDDDEENLEKKFANLLERHAEATGPSKGQNGGGLSNLGAVISSLAGGGSRRAACQECSEVVLGFCEAYHRMKVAELEADWRLSKLMSVMTSADSERGRENKFKAFLRSNSGTEEEEEEWLTLVEEMRAKLLQTCHWRLRQAFPRPLLKSSKIAEALERASMKPEMKKRRRWANLAPKYACPTCGKLCYRPAHLERHLKIHSRNSKPFKCNICHETYSTDPIRRNHKLRNHPEHVLANYKSAKMTTSEFKEVIWQVFRGLIEIEFRTVGKSRQKCKCCKKIFIERVSCELHILDRHEEQFSKEIRALQRGQPTSTSPVKTSPGEGGIPPNLAPTSNDAKHYKCSYCALTFTQRRNVEKHESRKHRALSEEDFTKVINTVLTRFVIKNRCTLCAARPSNRSECEQHVIHRHKPQFHEALKAYQQKLLDNPDALEGAAESGTPPSPVKLGKGKQQHSCPLCPRAFAFPVSLTRHMRTHREDSSPWKCRYCGHIYKDPFNRRIHALRAHPEQVLESYREPETSIEDFGVAVREVFKGLVGAVDSRRKCRCVICKREFTYTVYCHQHIVQHHNDHFSREIKAYQQRKPKPSNAGRDSREDRGEMMIIGKPFRVAEVSPTTTNTEMTKMEEGESEPVAIFVPKAEVAKTEYMEVSNGFVEEEFDEDLKIIIGV